MERATTGPSGTAGRRVSHFPGVHPAQVRLRRVKSPSGPCPGTPGRIPYRPAASAPRTRGAPRPFAFPCRSGATIRCPEGGRPGGTPAPDRPARERRLLTAGSMPALHAAAACAPGPYRNVRDRLSCSCAPANPPPGRRSGGRVSGNPERNVNNE
ncbi:hypothetical protein GCM10009802_48880 [Streptomyces synnematoformans]|uniref:Uncharacterized protein n=1 Tax=Streptomyces synnematoformans TaxID=415721 RepID=A0ABN2ZA31_9ACTN